MPPLDSAALNAAVDAWPVRHQAAIFNGAGRVFAPRYRQAHIRVFSVEDSLSLAALKLAYSDIRAAFQHFLDHWDEGRPLIIAAHSQGSWHARWLLQEFFDGTPLQERVGRGVHPRHGHLSLGLQAASALSDRPWTSIAIALG